MSPESEFDIGLGEILEELVKHNVNLSLIARSNDLSSIGSCVYDSHLSDVFCDNSHPYRRYFSEVEC